MKYCTRCKTEKDLSEFYNRRNGVGNSPYCKQCHKDQALDRQREFKRKSIEYKGGKCFFCGYSKHQGSLEFHHMEQKSKNFQISSARMTTFDERVIAELDKCILVCSNCHKEVHAGVITLDGVMESTKVF